MLATDTRRFNYVADYVRGIFLPQIEFARRHIIDRLLPTFDKISEEAELHGERVYDELMSRPAEDADDGSAADTANGAAEGHYRSAFEFRQGFLNLLFVHLYHLFEQQLASLVRDEQPNRVFDYVKSTDLYQGVYKTFGFDITFFETWEPVEELRWIANTVKHAEAKDAAKLKVQRPDLFIDPRMPADIKQQWEELTRNWPKPTQLPLVGEFFYPQPADYAAKVEAVLAFWTEFCSLIRGEKRKLRTLGDWVRENRDKILAVAEKYGASNVRLFGSVARGEAGPASDVDLLIDPGPRLSLWDHIGLENELKELLGRKVDVVSEGGIKPRYRERILSEAVLL